ncbi:membrane associated protein [Arthrobacter phage Eileen]|uniref:Lysin A n=2 Tax=Bridgettevirus TaxID=2733170 RepID=A0A3G2KI86_9CAUD|nr:membrane associated protein [Arthrobacter phage Eileen]YP_009815575.1 membrane associated protein [Arthrobacter phage Peas]AYN57814.1 lysin A [Arthrobacter phage Eileen]AYN58712.1 lysin A [Arthrobacter phage Peas]
MRQLITPNPNIPAEEGMCLQYVRQTFGLPIRYGSATEAWNNSPSKHRDRNYPKGVWFPVWWALDKNINGHVALVAPDGRVYSTSNLNPNPLKVHPSVADVEAYYAYYGMTLTYRGWTEDVAGYPVIAADNIQAESTTITSPVEEGFLMALTDDQQQLIYNRMKYLDAPISAVPDKTWEVPFVHQGTHSARTEVVRMHQKVIALTAAVTALAKNPNLTADQITDAVKAGLAEAVVDVDVNINGKEAV